MLAMHFESHSALLRQKILTNTGGRLDYEDVAYTAALNRSVNTNDALRPVPYLTFDRDHLLLLSWSVILGSGVWPKLLQYVLKRS